MLRITSLILISIILGACSDGEKSVADKTAAMTVSVPAPEKKTYAEAPTEDEITRDVTHWYLNAVSRISRGEINPSLTMSALAIDNATVEDIDNVKHYRAEFDAVFWSKEGIFPECLPEKSCEAAVKNKFALAAGGPDTRVSGEVAFQMTPDGWRGGVTKFELDN